MFDELSRDNPLALEKDRSKFSKHEFEYEGGRAAQSCGLPTSPDVLSQGDE
jgi:hypothetical protein